MIIIDDNGQCPLDIDRHVIASGDHEDDDDETRVVIITIKVIVRVMEAK